MEASGSLGADGPPPEPGQRDRYIVTSLIEEAIASSQIEGADTSRAVAREMLRKKRKPRDRAETMIMNNYKSMEYVREVRNETMTPELLFRIHKRVTLGTLENPEEAGRLRSPDDAPVHVFERGTNNVLFVPPPAEELPDRLDALSAFANGETPDFFLHPVLRSIILHFWLAYDHPFGDGNGRTARILFYWSMLRHGYRLFEFVPISPLVQKALTRYLRAFLETETDGNDLTYFILHHLDLLDRAIDRLQRYLRRKREETRQVERQLRSHMSLNHRQRALLAHALKHPDRRYTFRSHQTSHAIAYQTARTDLLGLEEAGLLRHTRQGRTLHFRPVGDLVAKLKGTDAPD
jgi:Fic family protein